MVQISVIIPTFNRRDYLRKALISVQAQKEASFEIIVVDDGSTDDTKSMLQQEFPNVRIISQEHAGPAAARNAGIREAKHPWIAFLDSDDEWKPLKLKIQMEFFEKNPDYLICQTDEVWIRNGVRVNPMKKHQKVGGWIFKECLPLCIISPSAVMIHKTLFDSVGLFNENYLACEDYDLWLRIAAKHPVGLIQEPLVIKYGGHTDQQSHTIPLLDKIRIDSIFHLIQKNELNEEQTKQALQMILEKSNIFIQGALKRGKHAEVQELKKKILSLIKNPNLAQQGITA